MKENSQLNKTIKLPELGEGVTEGELVKWLVSKGDHIKIDQAVAEVMTDKASMEVPSPLDGVVESFSAKEGDMIQVGQSLLTIKGMAQETKNPAQEPEKKPQVPSPKDVLKSADEPSLKTSALKALAPNLNKTEDFFDTEDDDDPSILATPFTRRLARELGVSLSQIKGSGLAGRITKEDVLKYSQKEALNTPATPATPATNIQNNIKAGFSIPKEGLEEGLQKRIPLKGVRKKIAEKMQESKTVIPHFTLLESADMEQLDKVKNTVKDMLKERKIKVTYLSFIMKGLLHTLKEFPELNASIDDFSKEIVIKNYYNFGFAVDTPRGLLVPVIKNVDKKSLAEISFEIQTLAEKARSGNISPDEMSKGTITITNIGSLGGEYGAPIINAPETAILGMYRLYVKPHWDGLAFVPKKTMNFSLTCDHRLIDGAVSARALKSFIHKVEKPLSLFI